MNSFIRDGVCSRKKRNGRLSRKKRIKKKTRTFTRIIFSTSDDDDDDDTNDTAVAVDNRPENVDPGITSVLNKGDPDHPSDEQTERKNIDSSNNADVEDLSSCVKDHKIDKNKGKHTSYEYWTNVTDRNEDLEDYLKGRDSEKNKIFELCYLNANFDLDKCISMMEQIGKKSYVHLEKIDKKRTKLIQSPCKEITKLTKPKMKRSHKLNCRINKKIKELFGKKYFKSDKTLMINELNNLKLKSNNNCFSSRIINFTDNNGLLSDNNETSLGKIDEVFSLQPTNDLVEKDKSPVSPVVEVDMNNTESYLFSEKMNLTANNSKEFVLGKISDVYSLQMSHDRTEINENLAASVVEVHENNNSKTSESQLFSKQTSLYANEICIEDSQDSKKLTSGNDKIEVINPPLHSNLIIIGQDGHVDKSVTDKKDNENLNDNETLKIKICTIIKMDDEVFSHRIVNDLALYFMKDDHLSKVDQLWGTSLSWLTADLITKLIMKFDSTKYNMAYLSCCLVCVFRVIEESSLSLPNEIKKKLTMFISAIGKYVKHLDDLMWKRWLLSNLFSDWFIFLAHVFIPNKNILTVNNKSLVNNATKYFKKIKHDKYSFKNKKLTEDGVLQFFNDFDSYSTDTNIVNNTATEETKLESPKMKNVINNTEKHNLIRTSELKIAKLALKKLHSAEGKNQIGYENVLENTNTIQKPTKNQKINYEEIKQPFIKPLMTENQNNKRKLEENNEHTTQKIKLNSNCSNEGNTSKTVVIKNNSIDLDELLTIEHLQKQENCCTGSKDQIEVECINVCSVPENIKINVPSQFSISNTFKNPTFGINLELLPELFSKNNNDNTTKNNCESPTIIGEINKKTVKKNNITNSREKNREIKQTNDKNIKKKRRSKWQKEALCSPEVYYQVGNNPQKFDLTYDNVVSKNLSPYYKNISASNLNSSHISSTQDSNNVNTQPSTAINTYPYSAINSWPSTSINTLPSIPKTTHSCNTTKTQSFRSVNSQIYNTMNIQPYSATNTQPSINTRPSSSMHIQPYSSMNTQIYGTNDTMNIQPYSAMNTLSPSIPNAQSYSATNTQPYPIVLRTLSPIVLQTLRPIVLRTLRPIVLRTLSPIVLQTLSPIVLQTLIPIVLQTLSPIVLQTLSPIVLRTLGPIVL
ncbi:Hypothetical protein CINCED_3A012519 [Cinara cedri]|uniref:Uncharacterized protein n=1 Tax=Cinara cedri TaxID=506608 RepID=A0A5E4MAK3_9HEMI|nr:Hypothetical protein CINCED_3A012519 [Cinara cedri]